MGVIKDLFTNWRVILLLLFLAFAFVIEITSTTVFLIVSDKLIKNDDK